MPLIFTQPYFIDQLVTSRLALLMHMEGTDALAGSGIYSDVAGASFTLFGAPTVAPGRFGNSSLRLGNTGCIRSTTRPLANVGTKDFTFEFFVRVNLLGAIGDHDYVNFDFYPIQIGMNSTRQLHFDHYNYGWGGTIVSSTALDTSGAWTHVAVARVNGITRMFFNGKKVGETTRLSGMDISQTGDFFVGSRANNAYRTATGNYDIDELRIIEGAGLYVNDFVPPTGPFSDVSITAEGWTVAWKAVSDNYNNPSATWAYDVDLSIIQKATEAAIAYYNPLDNTFTPIEMYSFPIPAEWKVQHPFNYTQADNNIVATAVATGVQTSGILRYGRNTFNTRIADPWVSGSQYGRIGITNTAAPFYNAFATSTQDYASRSDQTYSATASSGTRRFVILVR